MEVAVLRVGARVRRRSEGAHVLHGLHAPVGEVLVVLELVGVVLEDPELRGRLLLHVLGRAVHRLVGPRVAGPGRPLKVVAPLAALAGHARGQVLLQRLDAPVHHGNGVAVLGPLRAVHGLRGQLPVQRGELVATTKFPLSPVSSRAARLVARPTVSAFLFWLKSMRSACSRSLGPSAADLPRICSPLAATTSSAPPSSGKRTAICSAEAASVTPSYLRDGVVAEQRGGDA